MQKMNSKLKTIFAIIFLWMFHNTTEGNPVSLNGQWTLHFWLQPEIPVTSPENDTQSMWLIEYTVGNEKFTNHYLAGKAPFKLSDYEKWYKSLNIKRN